MSTNLENVLHCLAPMPSEIKRSLREIGRLDVQVKDLSNNVDRMQRKYLKRGKNKQYFIQKRKENKILFSNIKAIRKQIIRYGKEKIENAQKVYENVNFLFVPK